MSGSALLVERHPVRGAEADATGRLAVRAVCELMQESAARHASALGLGFDELHPKGQAWVLVQWALDVAAFPAWREEVTVETWPSGFTERTATREFRLLDASGEEAARASSVWMILDLARRRPVRMPEAVRSIRPARPPLSAETSLARLLPPEPVEASVDLAVRWSDLDLNAHVANVAYVDWVLESVPRRLLADGSLSRLLLSFRAECRDGAKVRVERGADPDAAPGSAAFRHRVVEASTGKELVLATTRFRSGG